MSFIDEMKQLSEKYDKDHPPKDEDDRLIEFTLSNIKKNISELVTRGQKQILNDHFPVACQSTPEYKVVNVTVKWLKVDITWDIKEKHLLYLKRLTDAAAKEGITIKEYSFSLEAMYEPGYEYVFASDIKDYQGTYSLPKKGRFELYSNNLGLSENWRIRTYCLYEFSVL